MTVSSSVNRNDYAGNGSTTNFAVSFRFLQNSDVKATLRDALSTETLQVETTDYTLTGAGAAGGGTLVMIIAPPTGTTLTIQRDVPATQETDYVENDEFPAESHEDALDKLTMLVQQQVEDSSRHMGFSDTISDASGSVVELSQDKTQRADKFIGFDSAGNLVTKTATDLTALDQDQQDKRLGPIFTTVAAMIAANPVSIDGAIVNLTAGMLIETVENSTGNGGGGKYLVVAGDSSNGTSRLLNGNGTTSALQVADSVDVRQCGAVIDAVLTDSTGIIAGTDNTTAVLGALALGIETLVVGGGCLVSELAVASFQTLKTVTGGWVTGPLNKSAIKIGDKDGVTLFKQYVDVETRHVKIFSDGSVATSKGFPGGALLAGNELTCGISIENSDRAQIHIDQIDGFVGLKTIHAFNTLSTPADVPAGATVDDLFFSVKASGEIWNGASIIQAKRFIFDTIKIVGTTDNDGLKSLVGIAKSGGSGGKFDIFGGFNGFVVEHECTAINIGQGMLQKQQSNNFVSSKGDQSAGPVGLYIGRLDCINGTTGFEIPTDCVEAFEAELSVGVLNMVNSGTNGLKLTNSAASIVRIGELYADNTEIGVSNAISDLVIDYAEFKDLNFGVSSSGAATTTINRVKSKGTIDNDIVNIGANGTVELGDLSGPATLASVRLGTSVTARMTGTIDGSQTVSGFLSSTTFSALDLNVIITPAGVKQTYFGPGIFNSAGSGTPESAVTANKGSEFTRLDAPSQSTLKYFKTSGSGNTGWVAVTLP
jgi:hypothetical protein